MSDGPSADGPWRTATCVEIVTDGMRPGDGGRPDLVEALRTAGVVVEPNMPTADLLVLDGATTVSPDAVMELRRIVDQDPMVVAAMPRILRPGAADLPEGARPPDIGYAVLPDPRCLYVKRSVLADLDDAAASASLLARLARLNRYGFRIALAGRAVAHHPAGASEPRVEDAPSALRAALGRYLASAPAEADRLLARLVPGDRDRLPIAFDLSALSAAHSGTSRLAAALVRGAAASWPDLAVHVIATPSTFAAHLSDIGHAVARVDPSDPRRFAAAIRIGQPFLWSEVDAFAARAPVLVLFLLDTIGLDCLAHATDELDALWRFVCAEADGLLFNSAFTERQFERRFPIRPGLPRRVSLHSLELSDYRDGAPAGTGEGVLVVGNRFAHKRLRETVAALARAGLGRPVTALGLDPGTVAGVTGVPSGGLTAERLVALYAAAGIVVYPSVYEGFGFPILEALAQRRPILVRDLPPYRELAAGLADAGNVHRYADDADLIRRLRDSPSWIESPPSVPARTWSDATHDLRAVLDAALAGVDRTRIVRRIDGLRGRMSYMRTLSLASASDGDTVERIAGSVGRLAQRAVMGVGRRVPSPLIALASRLRPRK